MKFAEIIEDIVVAIKKKSEELEIDEPILLGEGFVKIPVFLDSTESTGIENYYLGVSVMGKDTGIIYTFSLRGLLPDIEF